MAGHGKRQDYFDYIVDHAADVAGLRQRKEDIFDGGKTARIYKYCNIDTAQKILSSGLLLQPPDNFNDPFDCLARVNVWHSNYRFPPEADDVDYVLSHIKNIPKKYQLPSYVAFHDMRSSYCFAVTCFSESYNNHLMWSHYADSHKGLCLGFDVDSIIDHIHPCVYTHAIPSNVNWQSSSIALALIKGSAWAHEEEWRLVKKTIRPKMRLLASITHQIYNAVHTNPALSKADHEDWAKINTDLIERIESIYNEERIVSIKPSEIYLGLNIYHQYANSMSADKCKQIHEFAKREHIPVKHMRAQSNSFDMIAARVVEDVDWSQLQN